MKTKVIWAIGLASLAMNPAWAHDDASHAETKTEQATTTTTKVEPSTKSYKEIHTQELRSLLRSNPSVVLVDTRSAEYDDGHRIGNAKFLPYDTKEDIIIAALPDKNAMIVLYCVSAQCPGSKFLADRLVKLGYKNVWKYPEGIEEWESTGGSIDKVKPGQISGMEHNSTQESK